MIFPKELQMRDLALGLTAMAAVTEENHEALELIRNSLSEYSHETIYAAACVVAEDHGHELVVQELTMAEITNNWAPAFALGQISSGWVFGLCCDDGQFLMPPQYQGIQEKPESFTVIRSRAITRH